LFLKNINFDYSIDVDEDEDENDDNDDEEDRGSEIEQGIMFSEFCFDADLIGFTKQVILYSLAGGGDNKKNTGRRGFISESNHYIL